MHTPGIPMLTIVAGAPGATARLRAPQSNRREWFVVDKSWSNTGAPDFRIRTNDSPEQREAERARAREERARARVDTMTERLEARARARETQAAERERIRQERRDAEAKLALSDPHKAAAQRRRASGRKDIVREQRDTSHYAMIVDAGRIRTLAARGASLASLAAVFNLTEDQIAEALREAPADHG